MKLLAIMVENGWPFESNLNFDYFSDVSLEKLLIIQYRCEGAKPMEGGLSVGENMKLYAV